MAALYELARNKGALVAGGVNKSKILLGIGTEHGDLAYQFNCLGDLYQCQVLEMARVYQLPTIIIDRLLKVQGPDGQTLIQAVERTIQELDYYLYQIMDARISLAHLQKLGLEEEKLLWIYRRLRTYAFHRALPPQAEVVSAYIPRAGEW
jgi:NAD+ synthase